MPRLSRILEEKKGLITVSGPAVNAQELLTGILGFFRSETRAKKYGAQTALRAI